MQTHQKPDAQGIQQIFDRLAGRYDLFNSFITLGLDRMLRHETMRPAMKGMRVLDIGCGTGDLSLLAAKRVGTTGEVTGLDFSGAMLEVARRRAGRNARLPSKPHFVQASAESLPLAGKRFDLAVSGFVLRSLHRNIDAILSGVYASLEEGGMISFLDITEPKEEWKSTLWKLYMNTVAALCGKVLFGKNYPVFYLSESAGWFLNAEAFSKKLEEKGFRQVRVKKFLLGVIVIYQAIKPHAISL